MPSSMLQREILFRLLRRFRRLNGRVVDQPRHRLLETDLLPDRSQPAALLEPVPELAEVDSAASRAVAHLRVDFGIGDGNALAPRDLVEQEVFLDSLLRA